MAITRRFGQRLSDASGLITAKPGESLDVDPGRGTRGKRTCRLPPVDPEDLETIPLDLEPVEGKYAVVEAALNKALPDHHKPGRVGRHPPGNPGSWRLRKQAPVVKTAGGR